MPFVRLPPSFLLSAATALLMGMAWAPASAQGVYKCTVNGKATYQATPCSAGDGRELSIAPGPTEEQQQDAKKRADAEKARAGAAATPGSPQPAGASAQPQPVARKVDCAKLNQQRADAFGRRNATVRDSRSNNINQSSAVDRIHDEIRAIESQMVKGGCAPT